MSALMLPPCDRCSLCVELTVAAVAARSWRWLRSAEWLGETEKENEKKSKLDRRDEGKEFDSLTSQHTRKKGANNNSNKQTNEELNSTIHLDPFPSHHRIVWMVGMVLVVVCLVGVVVGKCEVRWGGALVGRGFSVPT